VTDNRVGGGVQSRLLISAPKGAARVVVSGLGGRQRTVSVPARRTVFVGLRSLIKNATGAIVVRPLPGSGPVYAARDLYEAAGGGPLRAVLPLRTAPRTVLAPAVHYDPDAALPGPHSSP
jgi:hypothetical protein